MAKNDGLPGWLALLFFLFVVAGLFQTFSVALFVIYGETEIVRDFMGWSGMACAILAPFTAWALLREARRVVRRRFYG